MQRVGKSRKDRFVNKIKLLFLKLKCCAYIHFRSILRKSPGSTSGNILIIISNGTGDALLDTQAFDALTGRYISAGKKIEVVSIPAVCSVMRMMPGMSEVRFIPCGMLLNKRPNKKEMESFKKTIEVLRTKEYEHIILKLNRNNLWVRCMATALSAEHISAVLYDSDVRQLKKRLGRWSLIHTTDDFLGFSDDLTQMQRSKAFALHFGAKAYHIGISYLPRRNDNLHAWNPYITVAVDSSGSIKQWPVEKFIALIHRLLEQYEYDVVLTGNNVAEDILKKYDIAFGSNSRIKNMIGKTNLYEWIELIRGAQFHIGVDSGSIHVAASVGTQAFCLTGVWDKHRFFPYQIEKNTSGTAVPICIYRSDVNPDSLLCANCYVYGDYGWKNQDCHKACKSGKPNLCLQNILVDDVMEVIKENHAV